MALTNPPITQPMYKETVSSLSPAWVSFFSLLVANLGGGISTTQKFKDDLGVTKTMTIKNGVIVSIV